MNATSVKVLVAALLIAGSLGFLLLDGRGAGAGGPGGAGATEKRPGPRELIAQGGLLLDVRTPGEFRSGHIDGAVNIPVDNLLSRISELGPKTRPIVVYCTSGSRSRYAAGVLAKQGFTTVYDLGSMSSWPRD